MTTHIRVVDDQEVVRTAAVELLTNDSSIDVIGKAANGAGGAAVRILLRGADQ